MHTKQFTTKLFILISLPLLISCGDDEDDNPLGLPLKDDGFFILNEGAFGNSNTSLSFYSRETSEVTNNIFQTVNNRPLGDQSQSMAIHNDDGFIVVQNSGKVEVIDVDDFTSIATISNGISSPRYFIGFNDNKGYLSDWGDGFNGSVHVIDLNTYSVTKSIETGSGSNQMVVRNGFVYVANNGGFGLDNTISVIDTNNDVVSQTIEVGDNPNNLHLDANNNIWVLGSGFLAFDADFNLVIENSSPSWLGVIDSGNAITLMLEFTDITFGTADDLTIDESSNQLYFNYNGGVWLHDMSATQLPTSPFIQQDLYGLSFDSNTGNLIGSEAPGFTSSGNLIFYDANGGVSNSFLVGIGPNSIVFKD
ncbi:MAG: hypothetical protein RJQ09_16445 [Cyclobacteriaceae bacterium]